MNEQLDLWNDNGGASPKENLHDSYRLISGNAEHRKQYPITRGVLDYFPDAVAYVARVSYEGNKQHNPGEEMHWARGKSMDHADCIGRHLIERGRWDTDGMLHSGKLAWRALALLQEELEQGNEFELPRGARLPGQ